MTPRTEKNRIIYLMSKTRKVFAQSSDREAHVKNARQTKLVIVDTTAALLCILSVNSILAPCVVAL